MTDQQTSLVAFETRYGLNIPSTSLNYGDWQHLMGVLRESDERVQFYKADMLAYAQTNFVVDKRNDKMIQQRLIWGEAYTPEEIAAFSVEQTIQWRYFRRIRVEEIARLANLNYQTVNNYLRVVRIWTLERRAEFDLSVIAFSDFAAAASHSIQDVPYEQQRAILRSIQQQRIEILTHEDATTIEATLPKTNAVLLQVKAAKAVHKVTSDSKLTFYPDQRFQRPLASKDELIPLLGEQAKKLPDGADVVGYAVEIKVWTIKKEESSGE